MRILDDAFRGRQSASGRYRGMRREIARIMTTSAARAYSLAMAFFGLVLTARWLGPHGRGLVATVIAWSTLSSSIAYLSLGQVAIHLSIQRDPKTWLPSMLGTLGRIACVICVIGWIVGIGVYVATGGAAFHPLTAPLLIMALVCFPLLVWEQYGSALLMATDRVDVYNRAQVLGRTVGLVAMLAMLAIGAGVTAVVGAIVFGQAVTSFTGMRALLRLAGDRLRYEARLARKLIGRGARLHANAVGAVAIANADALLLSHFRGATEAGEYQVAVQLLLMILFVAQAASTVMMSQVAQLGADAAWATQRKILTLIALLLVGMVGMGVLLAEPIVHLAFGAAFHRSTGIFRIVLLSTFGGASSSLLASQWVGRGYFTLVACIALVTAIANIAANLVVISRYGMYGSAWVLLGTSVVALACNIAMVCHCERRRRAVGIETTTALPGMA